MTVISSDSTSGTFRCTAEGTPLQGGFEIPSQIKPETLIMLTLNGLPTKTAMKTPRERGSLCDGIHN